MRSLPPPVCISVLLVHMMCGCRESQQEQIAEKLEPVGGVVVGDENLPNDGVIRVVLRGSKVSDVELQHLTGLEDLRHLYLDDSLVTDSGTKDISQLPAVQLLSIRNTQISDASVESISNMQSLRWLYVSDTKLSSRGIRTLRKALPNTRVVD